MDKITPEYARKAIEHIGFRVDSIKLVSTDIGHHKYRAQVLDCDDHHDSYDITFQSDLEKKWGEKTVESVFQGTISLERECEIYDYFVSFGVPGAAVKLGRAADGTPFLLREALQGENIQNYVASLPEEQRQATYLGLMRKVGALFAYVQAVVPLKEDEEYGDLNLKIENSVDHYSKRLERFLTGNLAWNPHEKVFNPAELDAVRVHARKSLEDVKGMEFPAPVLVLANTHRGNIYLDESGEIDGFDQCNFAQAGIPAAEFYNAFWQFANPAFARTADVHKALVEGYRAADGTIDLDDTATRAAMRALDLNHFLRAATIYATKPNDPMRNRWGHRFKDEIVMPLVEGADPDYDLFSQIINEKWEKK
ncbi:hypothetical protein COV20_03830 [Candidatus Woesearchaeota archaeon CG10_big_fil_rev_8_21_14_0_10_45_16]|nr:MAG: hypothetical protein COV20_03830 [Candidatus Woesearchaeota archaeon CG10_big_fil_rev_8_21_14_0_10_45_16]